MVGTERRKYLRFNTVLHGSYELSRGEGKGRSEIKNISREGIQILVDRQLDKGSEVDLNVSIPGDDTPITAHAEVVWNRGMDTSPSGPYTTGLRFTNVDRFDRARLLDYVYSQWRKFLKREV